MKGQSLESQDQGDENAGDGKNLAVSGEEEDRGDGFEESGVGGGGGGGGQR